MYDCGPGVHGRYVSVNFPITKTEGLHMCEVEVHGKNSDCALFQIMQQVWLIFTVVCTSKDYFVSFRYPFDVFTRSPWKPWCPVAGYPIVDEYNLALNKPAYMSSSHVDEVYPHGPELAVGECFQHTRNTAEVSKVNELGWAFGLCSKSDTLHQVHFVSGPPLQNKTHNILRCTLLCHFQMGIPTPATLLGPACTPMPSLGTGG